ncbi:MAG: polyamine aminopropyltransferase [Rhodospirillales bacterium]|nr:polyamine aminopropyltransferase [Rhodospirillales bacterium]
MTWFTEALYADPSHEGYAQTFYVLRELVRRQTDFQELVIFETPHHGRVLALDGVIQATEKDEFVYHEMLAHVPLFALGSPKRVLVIGGGDGGILREVLRHPVEQVRLVEIDGTVVDLCRQYLPSLSAGAFDDPRAQVTIGDGIRFVAETTETFDLIIVDSTDPAGPGEGLFTEAFYADCKKRLAPGGLVVTQNGVPHFQPQELARCGRRLKPHFADVSCYLVVVPTYVGGFMALGWATDDAGLRKLTEADLAPRFARTGFSTRYYSPAVHAAAFALPPFIAKLVA